LLAIARENKGVAARVLDDFNADSSKIRSEMMLMLSHGPRPAGNRGGDPVRADAIEVDLSPAARLLLMSAGARALDAGRTKLEPNDLLEALLADERMELVLSELGVDIEALRERMHNPGGRVSDFGHQN
jgi:ATP-dependent Clp protease ATP-binding subunit ClpA